MKVGPIATLPSWWPPVSFKQPLKKFSYLVHAVFGYNAPPNIKIRGFKTNTAFTPLACQPIALPVLLRT